MVVEGYFGNHALLPFIQPSEGSVTPEVGYCLRRMWLEMVVRDSGRVSKTPGENLQPQTELFQDQVQGLGFFGASTPTLMSLPAAQTRCDSATDVGFLS